MEAWAIEAHWLWLGAGVLLLVGEALLPGTVLLWFGIAAIITGSVTFLLAPAWDTQVLIFSVLGVASTAVFWYWRKHNPQPESQGPKVNQAGAEPDRHGADPQHRHRRRPRARQAGRQQLAGRRPRSARRRQDPRGGRGRRHVAGRSGPGKF